MTGLLDLPYEVRQQILGYAVGYVAKAPIEAETELRFPQSKRPQDRTSTRLADPDLVSLNCSVYQVNKQIRQEALDVADLAHSVEYHLDLVVLGQGELAVPTWTYISRASRVVDVLKCTVRPQGRFHADSSWNSFRPDRRVVPAYYPPRFVWAFDDLMNRFFTSGPTLRKLDENQERREHLIKKLIIDVQSPTLEEGTYWWHQPGNSSDQQMLEKPRRLHADSLHAFLVDYMGRLVKCQSRFGNWCEFVYTHVGQIEFRQDGNTTKIYDLDANLRRHREFSMSPEYENRTPRTYPNDEVLRMWLPLAQRRRADRGLGVRYQGSSNGSDQTAEAAGASPYQSWSECDDFIRSQAIEMA